MQLKTVYTSSPEVQRKWKATSHPQH